MPEAPHGPAHRILLLVGLWGLVATVALGAAHAFWPGWDSSGLGAAHRGVALAGFLLPAMTFLHLHALDRLAGRRASRIRANFRAFAFALAALLALGAPLADASVRPLALAVSGLALLVAAGATTGLVLRLAPKPSERLADVQRDPLTKGDDASFAHVRFAHMLLPVGLGLAWLGGPWWQGTGVPWERMAYGLQLAGDHLLLAGYGLLSLYGLSHLWVPRLSGVPAIAAGAIKGELHTARLAMVLMPIGFLLLGYAYSGPPLESVFLDSPPQPGVEGEATNATVQPAGQGPILAQGGEGFGGAALAWGKGLLITGGLSLFIGAFTFMGVLGANIMKNKSPTQRVTPEFVYVPWTFAGSFWMIAGVLLGVFLNAAPASFEGVRPALRFVHAHLLLLGGFGVMLLGYAHRILPDWLGHAPPTFRRTKWAFYILNTGIALLLMGRLASSWAYPTGATLVVLGVGAWFFSLAPYLRAPEGR